MMMTLLCMPRMLLYAMQEKVKREEKGETPSLIPKYCQKRVKKSREYEIRANPAVGVSYATWSPVASLSN